MKAAFRDRTAAGRELARLLERFRGAYEVWRDVDEGDAAALLGM